MSAFIGEERCICGDPHCVGCACGMDCAYSPGHEQGTTALSPLAAMIEATERLLAEDLAQGNEGMPVFSPGLRRLRATLAFARCQTRCRSVRGGEEHLRASPISRIQ